MNKRNLTVFLVFAMFMLSTFAMTNLMEVSGAAAKSDSANAVKHVAIVFSTGGLGDKSFNDAGFVGAQRANDTSKVQIDYVEPKDVNEINQYIESFASSTTPVYDLIIAIGFSSADGVNASSIAHPDRNFAIIDDNSINRSNVADITFKEQEGSFLVGAMAAMTTKSNVIGFLGGLDIPLINKFRSGYEQGAHYVNSSIQVLAQYAPDPSNPWGDTAGGKQVANTEISQGADVIYAAAGGTGLGVFDAANETTQSTGKKVYAIGVDSDQDYIQPGIVLCSMVKRVDTAVYNLITTTIDGTIGTQYLGKAVALGLAQNGVAISNMTYTQSIAQGTFSNGKFTTSQTRWQIVQSLRTAIINGTISVSPTIPTTPATSSGSSDTSTPGFEFPFVFIAIAVIPILNRKLRKK